MRWHSHVDYCVKCAFDGCFRATKQVEDLDNERKSLTRQNKEKDAKLQGFDALFRLTEIFCYIFT